MMKNIAQIPDVSLRHTKKNQLKTETEAIKVLHIMDLDNNCYIWNTLCDYTDTAQADLVFVTFQSETSEFVKGMKRRGVQVYALDATSRKQYPQAVKRLWHIIKKEHPDVIHTHLFDPTLIGVTMAKLLGLKSVVTRHHTDAVHLLQSKLKRRFYLGLERYINFCADHLIALSRFGRNILIEKENVPSQKVSLIPNGQTAERFDKISEECVQSKRGELKMNGQLSIVCTSRLYPGKGHIYLFQALAPLIKDGLQLKLYLVGKGDYQGELENLATEYNIRDNVEFLGWRTDALEIAAAADLIIHPSLEDALSSAVIEALMLSRPLIASDISGVRDILDDGRFGVIVPPADSEAIRQALKEMIQNLDAARARAKNARNYILKNMGAEQFADGYIECYRNILSLKPSDN